MTSTPHPTPAADLLLATAAPALIEEGSFTLVADVPDDQLVPEDGEHAAATLTPLVPRDVETPFTQTRRLRHDGWVPETKRTFLEALAVTGVIKEACFAAKMSARAAYNLRDRDTLFAAGWEAALLLSRRRLADELLSRAMNGVVERIYQHGAIVAERHRYDNRLAMAVLRRLDARVDQAEARADPAHNLTGCWDQFLSALAEDRTEDGRALLAAAAAPSPVPAPAPAGPADAPKVTGETATSREVCEHEGKGSPDAGPGGVDFEAPPGRWWAGEAKPLSQRAAARG